MRGKRRACPSGRLHLRNIPAYAGKTLAVMFRLAGVEEHPRVCGENEGILDRR